MKLFDADQFLARFWAMDAELVAAGFHATSPWWRRNLERFIRALAAGRRGLAESILRRWIIRAGRRSGKSSFLCRLAVAWAKWGPWSVPAGDVAVAAFVSVNKTEAESRLRTIADILRVLGESFERRNEEIELSGSRHVVFRAFACTVTAVVGFTSILIIADEVARWESRDHSANPAKQVFGSLLPTMASQPWAFAVLSSSVWSSDDYHAELFDQGNNDFQIVSEGTTWECNPSITEAQTRALEPDEQIWNREYNNQPGAVVSNAVDPADNAAMFTTESAPLRILEIGGWEGTELQGITMRDITRQIAARARKWGALEIVGDQREEASLRSMFAEDGISFRSYAWSAGSKETAVQLLRRMQRERLISSVQHDKTKRQLGSMKARLAPSGITTYSTNGLDYASAFVTLMHAAADRRLNGGGFVAIDASSLRGDGFTYICGSGSADIDGEVDYTVGRITRSARRTFGNDDDERGTARRYL